MIQLTQIDSINHIQDWSKMLRDYKENPAVLLAINKMDIPEENYKISKLDILSNFEKQFHDISFISAYTGQGIDKLFEEIARTCLTFLWKLWVWYPWAKGNKDLLLIIRWEE